MENKVNQNILGLNLDSVNYQIKDNFVTYALNANVQSFDGDSITYTNEPSNQACYNFEVNKPGFKIVGNLHIVEQNKLIVFLAHPDGRSEIGEITHLTDDCESIQSEEVDCGCPQGTEITSTVVTTYLKEGEDINNTPYDSCCRYSPIITDNCLSGCNGGSFDTRNCCLNLSIEFPVYATYRIDGCKTRIYFISKNNPPRRFTIGEPFGKNGCEEIITCIKDGCSNLDLFPSYCHPDIFPIAVESGGSLKAGAYSFAIGYTDKNGGEITDYHDLTNPISIFERKITEQTEYVTSKSIKVRIEHKETQFTHFNLIVAENVNETTTYHLVGTYRIPSNQVNEVVYTGDYKSTFSSITPLIRTPHYDTAGIIEKQNDILMLADLEEAPKYNFQLFANKLKLYWETVEMPADGKFDYSNPEVAYFFRTYQRDEVYPFGIKFKLKNGKYTDVFHIPGRKPNGRDLNDLTVNDQDVFKVDNDCIVPVDSVKEWQVYNTSYLIGDVLDKTTQYYQEEQFNCKITNHQYGEFAYWESTEFYPCNTEVWGELAGTPDKPVPIRHHKFPDSLVSHIHDGLNENYNMDQQSNIYPIGVRLDEQVFNFILNQGIDGKPFMVFDPITNKDVPIRDLICGFELVRGNRVNNKSVIAKGLLYDVAKYELHNEDGSLEKSYYYGNYPFNDLGTDQYLASSPVWYDEGNRGNILDSNFKQEPFNYQVINGIRYQNRFNFYSPDTTFQYPKIGTELKLETIEYGQVLGHFVPVEEHPQYKYFNNVSLTTIFAIGTLAAFTLSGDFTAGVLIGTSSSINTDINNQITQTQLLYDIIEKLIPYQNFAYQYNGIAGYNNYSRIDNNGNKRRFLDLGNYIDSKIVEIGDEHPIHNRLKESSVYLRTSNKFIQQIGPVVDENYDNSRYSISDYLTRTSSEEYAKNPTRIYDKKTTRAYYGSIKRNFVNQYGQIENIRYVSTGYVVELEQPVLDQVNIKPKYYPAFGGDTYINKFALKRKHSFFTRNLANLQASVNDVPFDYWLFPNLAYPAYYIGTSSEEIDWADIATLSALVIATVTAITVGGSTGNVLPPPPAPPVYTTYAAQAVIVGSIQGILTKIYDIKKPKINLDNREGIVDSFYKKGQFYTASYGIPIFFVESDINVDFRHGRNDKEENFYPNVSDEIPDEWLQEINVPIKYDNFYHYNATYSAQNVSPNLPYDVTNPNSDCVVLKPNRVIYSERASTTDYYSDGWRVFKRGNLFDFPKEGGRLINLTAGENELVYARFENTTKIYGARVQIESTSPVQLEVGDASMFKQKPIDISKSDLGYVGSQHKAQARTEFGTYWVDAKRGHIYEISKQGFNEIKSDTNYNWFKQNLPFRILKDFPNADIDNPAKGIGIIMGWDERFERVFITKLDYKLTGNVKVTYDEVTKKYYNESNQEVLFSDGNVWENHSWTIAYSPKLKNFISFYSFTPNYYIPLLGNFQTIINKPLGSSTWNHNLNPYTYQTFYGNLYPYILEYSTVSLPKATTVNSVSLIQELQEYYSTYEYYSLGTSNNKNLANFTKAIIYNREQSSGIINLIPEEFGNTRQKIMYPRATTNGLETIISRRENTYTFNGFWSVTNQSNGQPLWSTKWVDRKSQHPIDKVVNTKTVIPSSIAYQKQKIKSDLCKIRLIQDKYSRYRFINNLQITQIN